MRATHRPAPSTPATDSRPPRRIRCTASCCSRTCGCRSGTDAAARNPASPCRPTRLLRFRPVLPLNVSGSVAMALCFIEPQDAIRVIAESVGREARRQLLGEVVRAWVDELPDQELCMHYAQAISGLDDDDLQLLAAWHASLEVGQPIPNTDFLVGV